MHTFLRAFGPSGLRAFGPSGLRAFGRSLLIAIIALTYTACEREDLSQQTSASLHLDGAGNTGGGDSYTEHPWLQLSGDKEFAEIAELLEGSVSDPGSPSDQESFPATYLNLVAKVPGFTSYSHFIEAQEAAKLRAGWTPSRTVEDDYYADKHEGLLLNRDGIIQIGDTIIMVTALATYRTPAENIGKLLDVATEGGYESDSPFGGVIITPRSGQACSATASAAVNHANRTAIFDWQGPTPDNDGSTELLWSVSNQTGNFRNQTQFQVTFPGPGQYQANWRLTQRGIVSYTTIDSTLTDGVWVYRETTRQRYGVVCTAVGSVVIQIGVCNVSFSSTAGIDGLYSFVNQSSVPFGPITGYLWNFGDGTTSVQANPTHTYPCDKPYNVSLIVFSTDYPNGQASQASKITVDGYQCCDKNADSGWTPQLYNNAQNQFEHRFDLGSEIYPWDQRLKAEMKHFRLKGNGKWKKEKAQIQASFREDLFGIDEDDCFCQLPNTPVASPGSAVNEKTQTFKDKITTGHQNRDKWLRIKQDDPVWIDYRVGGQLLLQYNTATSTGFECE